MSDAKRKENDLLARQLDQLAHEAHREIFNELVQSGIEFHESHGGRDIRLQMLKDYQIWRDRCVASAESISSKFLINCKELKIDQNKSLHVLQETMTNFINDSHHSLELNHKTYSILQPTLYHQYVSEAEELRPYLDKRIAEIVENAKDGFCQGRLIYRHEKSPHWIIQFWRDQWQKILVGVLAAAGGAIAALIGPTLKTAITAWLNQ